MPVSAIARAQPVTTASVVSRSYGGERGVRVVALLRRRLGEPDGGQAGRDGDRAGSVPVEQFRDERGEFGLGGAVHDRTVVGEVLVEEVEDRGRVVGGVGGEVPACRFLGGRRIGERVADAVQDPLAGVLAHVGSPDRKSVV